jgi:hypothetical protein
MNPLQFINDLFLMCQIDVKGKDFMTAVTILSNGEISKEATDKILKLFTEKFGIDANETRVADLVELMEKDTNGKVD